MPYTPTGRPVGRPKTKDSKTISLKMPQDLLDRVQRYAREHHQSVSALIREGLEWRMTEGAPRGQPAHGQRSAGQTAFDELAQPVPLIEEGMPFDEELAGALQASAPQTWGETWSKQAVVALILRWYEEGMTKTAIATRLNAAHVPPIAGLVVPGRNNPSLYTVNGRPLYVHLNGLAIV
jgi:hypothetical protein